MPRIFLSYRRGDLPDLVGRIFDALIVRYGKDVVFLDVESVEPAMDFEQAISNALSKSNVLVALIGPNWSGLNADGKRKIDDEDDWVRTELLIGLTNHLPIVPVLLNQTSMPKSGDLPTQLSALAKLQAITIESGRTFRRDMDELADVLVRYSAPNSSLPDELWI